MSEASVSAAQRCCLCDRGLSGHVLFDPRGRGFCRDHLPAVSLCRYCQHAFLHTERSTVCSGCRARAVSTDAEARRLVELGPLAWFESHRLATGRGARSVRLSHDMPVPPSGGEMFGYVQGAQVVIRHGLPGPVFLLVAAHELGHLWLSLMNARLSEADEEGICDWLSWRFARSLGHPEYRWLADMIARRCETGAITAFRDVRARLGDAEPSDLPTLLPMFRRRVLN